MTTILAKIQMRRGTAAEWAAANPVLAEGELAFETDTGRTKIGNGVTGYNALPSYPTLDEMLEAQGIVESAVEDAEAAETNAAASAAAAAGSASASQTSSTAAATSASAAGVSATAASASAAAALGSASNAQSDRVAAQAAGTTATNAKDLAQAAQLAAEAARNQAQAAQTAVAGVVSQAEDYADQAYQSAVSAEGDAASTAADRAATFADRAVTTADRTAASASAVAAQGSQTAAAASASTAATKATEAATSAQEAAASAASAAAGISAAAASATAAAASQAAASSSAASAAATAATFEDTYGAFGDIFTARDEAAASADAAEGSADAALLQAQSAAQSALVAAQYSVASGLDTATRNAQAAAALAQGFAQSAASVAQQDLSGVTAQALHRSPNAITSMFIYDTSKDSDGGAWTEKCQHTSWYNEPLAGKWLGAHTNELQARTLGAATLGPELIANGSVSLDTTGWSATNATLSSVDGKLRVTGTASGYPSAWQAFPTVIGRAYRVSFTQYTKSGGSFSVNKTDTTSMVGANRIQLHSNNSNIQVVGFFIATATTTYLHFGLDSLNPFTGFWAEYDDISVREVQSVNAAPGDYFQSATDGKFYRLWKNLLSRSSEFDHSAWNKAQVSITPNADIAPDGTTTADVLVPNTTASRHWVSNGSLFAGYTLSVYAKANVGSLHLWLGDSALGARVYFNLANGTIASGSGGTIEAVGNGWYRCSIVNVTSNGVSSANTAWIGASVGTDSFAASNGTDSILLWGAQLEYGGSVTTYEPKAAEGSISEVFRGNKADFPRLAALVTEASNLTIYDLTETGRPMWMRFIGASGADMLSDGSSMPSGGSSVAMLNGLMTYASAGVRGPLRVNFVTERAHRNFIYTNSYCGTYLGTIAERNAGKKFDNNGDGVVVHWVVNAVAMAVLPDAPIDPATGLHVPTVAIGTASGISVIKHNGIIVNITGSVGQAGVGLHGTRLLGAYASHGLRRDAIPAASTNDGVWGANSRYGRNIGSDRLILLSAATNKLLSTRNGFFHATSMGVTAVRENMAEGARGLMSYFTNSYTTGWMPGDTRRAYLSDTEVNSVVGSIPIDDGFDYADTTALLAAGWLLGGDAVVSEVTVSGSQVVISNADNSNNNFIYQNFTTSTGQLYKVTVTASQVSTQARVRIRNGDGNVTFSFSGQIAESNALVGTFSIYFTALSATTSVCIGASNGAGSASFQHVRIEAVVLDRSYKSATINPFGTLSRAALATGTSLVGYSGFSTANYLREPYSADLDFGTGEWSCSAWVNFPASPPTADFALVNTELFVSPSVGGGWVSNGDGSYTNTSSAGGQIQKTGLSADHTGFELTFTVDSGSMNIIDGAGSFVGTYTAGTYTVRFGQRGTYVGLRAQIVPTTISNISLKELRPAAVASRSGATGPAITLAMGLNGRLVATAFDGTTTRTVTTTASYNTATWLKAEACYTTDGTLSIRVNGREVATSRGNPLLSLNSRYNLLTSTEMFDAWIKLNCTVTTDAIAGPIGASLADALVETTATSAVVRLTTNFTAPTANTVFSLYAKKGERQWLVLKDNSGLGAAFDLINGTVTNYGRTGTVTGVGDGWYRCSISGGALASPVYIQVGTSDFINPTYNSVSGTVAIYVWGAQIEVGSAPTIYQRVTTATDFDFAAPLTIGNSFAADAPFPGSIALLKLGATVPTYEQSQFMYEQEKQLFRAGAQSVLPDSGSIVDMAYDDATDRWVAVSATNESYWTGLVRNSVTPVPAGSYTRVVAGSGLELVARSTTNPGVDVTIPSYGLREELVKRAEAAARLTKELVIYDYVGGFTASTTTGSTAITSVAGLTYPASYIGARISGSGIPANTTIVAVSGTTIYLSAAATATATGVSISFLDFELPVGMEAKTVMVAGAVKQEGSTKDYTRLYDGFIESIRFGVAPGATAWVQIQAQRITLQ